MFIKLKAAFTCDDQPDFESMGIIPTNDGLSDSEWSDFYVQHDCIVSMNINNVGSTNIILITGEKWTVQESPEQIINLINEI